MSALTDYLENKKILILGMGREGRSSLRYITTHVPSATVALADRNDPHIEGFDGFYGEDYLEHMDGFDLVLKSPGIPFVGVPIPDGTEITCQTDLFLRFSGCVCVGVTGTKGKTTTSTLIHEILQAAEVPHILAGNIGVPVLDVIDDCAGKIAVLELSCHQLEFMRVSPHVAVFTNLYPEHLDHYDGFAGYAAAKMNITLHQTENDYLIYGDVEGLREYLAKQTLRAQTVPIGYDADRDDPFLQRLGTCNARLVGKHNAQNTFFAAAAARRLGIPDDAIHEVPYYRADFDEKDYPEIHDKNNILTLGLLRLCIPAAIDMAEALGVDEDRRKQWAHLLERLSPYPTFLRRGKRVYRYTEKGMAWNPGNDVGQQHIFPCGGVGLGSAPEELAVARNTVNQRKFGFTDGNAVSSFYAIGARVGFDPAYMTDRLREFDRKTLLPNLLHDEGGGGLEYCAVAATALNEMALQSHPGVVRIFPDWDGRLDCAYENLRADGAFLVSAEIKGGVWRGAKIASEKGRTLRAVLPDGAYRAEKNGEPIPLPRDVLEKGIATAPGDVFTFCAET